MKDLDEIRQVYNKIKQIPPTITTKKEKRIWARKRGYKFEKIIHELLKFEGLKPIRSYKVTGEQIDGSFTFDNTDYLLEAKWQEKPITASDLYNFGGKISGKLKNTLGLYVSLGVYSSECTETQNPTTKSMILMDGPDLIPFQPHRLYIENPVSTDLGQVKP